MTAQTSFSRRRATFPVSFSALALAGLICGTGCSFLQKKGIEGAQQLAQESAPIMGAKSIESKKPSRLGIRQIPGREEKSRFYSNSFTKNYDDDQLVHERSEIAEFVVRTRVMNIEPKSGQITIMTETLLKEGPIDMHDLAFPELGEKLFTAMLPSGEILFSGNYPKDSIFYVPAVPYPEKEVQVGDSWKKSYAWRGMKNQLKLALDVTVTYKNLFQCNSADAQDDQCAELEMSGTVHLPDETVNEFHLESEVRGRMLIALSNGTVIWSVMRNSETIKMGNKRTEVMACVEGLLEFPDRERWAWRSQPKCEPDTIAPERVPGS